MSHSGGKTGVGLLSLKWNNYKAIFFETIKTLREKSKYTDATLAVDGHFYHVHKLVMSTCSDYFSDIFEKTPCKAPIIVLKDVSKDEIEGLLSYMYLGEVNVHHDNLASFLKTAESLKIKGLAVSDDEPRNLSKSQNSSRVSPSHKKRRLENTESSPVVKSLKKSDTLLAMKVELSSPEMSKDKPPMVKIGMSDADDRERRIRTKINYEEDPGSDQDSGDIYEPNSPMAEHDALDQDEENYASTSFCASALQQSGEVEWEEENASNVTPETHMGGDHMANVSTSSQTQGANSHCTVPIPKLSVLSKEDVEKLKRLEKKLKEAIDGMNELGRQAAAFYYMNDDMRSYGNPAMVMVGLDVAAVQSHPRFHDDYDPLQKLNLPTPPNLSVMTLRQAREFLKIWLPKFLGHFPGYGKPECKPIWWPIEWIKSPQLAGTDKMQVFKIIAAIYQHYEKVEVVLPPAVPQTQVPAIMSMQPETSSGEFGQWI